MVHSMASSHQHQSHGMHPRQQHYRYQHWHKQHLYSAISSSTKQREPDAGAGRASGGGLCHVVDVGYSITTSLMLALVWVLLVLVYCQ